MLILVQEYPNIRLNEQYPVLNVGSSENPSYLPAEVCVVLPGQVIKRRLSPDQTQQLITFACRKPWENGSSIVGDGKAALGLNASSNPFLVILATGSTFESRTNVCQGTMGIQVGQGLITVAARLLPPPALKYKDLRNKDMLVTPKFGSWNMANTKFHTAGNLGRWTYILFKSNRRGPPIYDDYVRETVMKFKEFLDRAGINAGGFIQQPPPPVINLADGSEAANHIAIESILTRMNASPATRPRFVLAILPYNDVAIYNSIKTVADTKLGINTVCVVAQKFLKEQRQDQYFGNISLKFNLKAGGINHTLDPSKLGIIAEGKTMLVGLDVTHPSPGSNVGAPSGVAIVASTDSILGQWPGAFAFQEGGKEMVTALEGMFLSRLRIWEKHNRELPDNVILYRDGVSEGQYQQILDQELPLIRSACKQAYPATKTKAGFPKLSIVVCGKRHHTRFYPTQEAEADRSSNCAPGTIVDRGVVEVRSWDFFLQPHACLQGTARPGHYYVVLDEILRGRAVKAPLQNAADALEDLTHNLCHLFGRATKAVSLCPPAYYADLLCTRLRAYLSNEFDPNDSSATASVSSGQVSSQPVRDVKIAENLKDSMFYI
jgi:eukaryotic translation initiation factor 2C